MNQHSRIDTRGEASARSAPVPGRFVIESVYPAIEMGRFPVKRVAGNIVDVWVDIFRDGHDVLAAALRWRPVGEPLWHTERMTLATNDRWSASFVPREAGRYEFIIEAWTDQFATWQHEFLLKREAGQDVTLEILEGCELLRHVTSTERRITELIITVIDDVGRDGDPTPLASEKFAEALWGLEPRPDLTSSEVFPIVVDRPIARASAWYEMFPRSAGGVGGGHGTFDDVIARLPDIAGMGFDVLYLPPIHPIGQTNRKGRNNSRTAERGDPGSPYAIGSADGGHDAIHPELGTLADFRRLVEACKACGMEVALDFAIQCAPDHPWLKQHPQWFKRRPDGTIRYAENPPKKYEDIVNVDPYCDDREALWHALRDVVLFWVGQGVRIFRVDNPHTKPLPFWEWLIAEVKQRDPGVMFLSEAFTRPKLMKALAKLGFSQSYTYFTWRTGKQEFTEYLEELARYPERDFYRPNFFVNTPDILPYHLQSGETWMFKARAALAATLSSNYGVYSGFELIEHAPIPGKEEYLDSEKYEIKPRDWNKPGNIKRYLTELNRMRRQNPALLQTSDIRFAQVDSPQVIGFVKESVDKANAVAVAIALDAGKREFWFHFGDLQIGPEGERRNVRLIENLVTGEVHRLEWGGVRLAIDPDVDPALLFRCVS